MYVLSLVCVQVGFRASVCMFMCVCVCDERERERGLDTNIWKVDWFALSYYSFILTGTHVAFL